MSKVLIETQFLMLSLACDIVQKNIAKISLFVMFIIFFLFLVSTFYFVFFFLAAWQFVTRHPLPVTRYPPPVTRYPPPTTRHPSPAEKSCRHAPSRLSMNKLKSLLQKTRKVTLFVWKSIRKNTPLSSEIHCYVKSRKGLHLNRYRSNSNSVRFLLKGQLQN